MLTLRTAMLLPLLLLLAVLTREIAYAQVDPMRPYDVVWETPSRDSSGSMPIGNGDIGLNLWIEEGGDLLFYIGKTDAWSENARLLKLGRVRVSLSPNPLIPRQPFRQTLRLGAGEIEILAGDGPSRVMLRVWVDANQPVIRVETEGRREFDLNVVLEVWRRGKRQLEADQLDSAYGLSGAPHAVVVYPDVVLPDQHDRVVWYHRNRSSIWPETLMVQGMEAWMDRATDPLLGRTFGGLIKGHGLVSAGPAALRSARPQNRCLVSIYVLTDQTKTADEWLDRLENLATRIDAVGLEQAQSAHRRWWERFWQRSWIRVSGTSPAADISTNDLPLRIGADSEGQNQFIGSIRRAHVFSRALSADEIKALALGQDAPLAADSALVGDWALGELRDGAFPNAADDHLPATPVGEVHVEEGPNGKAIRLSGRGWVEVADDPRLDLTAACTLAAWVCPEELPPGGGRIIDKSRATTANGYLLDTYPGNSLRLIVEAGTLTHDARLPAGEWSHVAGTFDAASGQQTLYVNGEAVASQVVAPRASDVSQAYALQRFISACAARGAYPPKFNGSIFNVDVSEPGRSYDADYRQWGGPYWFQNTRLIYWPMLASGDFDLMQSFFRMYLDALPFAEERTRVYFGHEGAFFPETMYFWAAYATDNYGWDREGKHVSQVDNRYIRYYWSGALELLAMMLDHYGYTLDDGFARECLLPFAAQIITFYDQHYPRDEHGHLHFEPAQALETWPDAVNPLPEIAGLRFALQGLLTLPTELTSQEQRAQWERLLGELPPLPTREVVGRAALPVAPDGRTILAPADQTPSAAINMENPELYAIFPYRLYGVGKPDLELARRTFEHRNHPGNRGWQQNDTQAAFLGLAQEAQRMVADRFATKNPGSRFPAFWGPNFDWIPDQDHGSNGLMALQTMLLQADGRKIILFPAWPKEWDVEFKLHAPLKTTVEGVYRGGELQHLQVTPAARERDLVVMEPQ